MISKLFKWLIHINNHIKINRKENKYDRRKNSCC